MSSFFRNVKKFISWVKEFYRDGKFLKYPSVIIVLLILWGAFNVYRESERALCYVHFKDQNDVAKACDGIFSIKNVLLNFGQWR